MGSLKPVSSDNWYDCTKLEVTKDQTKVFPAQSYIGLLNLSTSLNINRWRFIIIQKL